LQTSDDAPPTLDLHPEASQALQHHATSLLSRTHALVEMHKLEDNARIAASKHQTSAAPLVQSLNSYPTPGVQVDLTKLVQYPPKIQPVPVKPLFLDVAWNYIDYPGRKAEGPAAKVGASTPADTAVVNGEEEKPREEKKSRGWFGFGRG